ncbi:MAG TPA: 2-oxoglutarate dehydrogenase complex dihydrolipoyllysine-residue succinyltransferase, partial [Dongiaceae bacterium]
KAAPAAAPAAPAAAPAAPAKAASDDLAPAVRKLVTENNLDPAKIAASGKDGRLTKEDVLTHLKAAPAAAPAPTPAPAPVPAPVARPAAPVVELPHVPRPLAPNEERVPMSRLRRRVAERLKQAQNNAAMLTTFNEVDMGAVMALRDKYKEGFEKRHKVKLGFMGFFVRAAIQALKEIPAVNGEIDGGDIIFKNHYDIGVAVGTEQGLVVPVVRDADKLSLAEIEAKIAELGRRARDGKLAVDELMGGTFTISNGGVYGSLMSTPILNPPQSGILGMHKIQQRPMVVDGKIEIRPMMYLALSYDHRIIDGREAVTFLVRMKDCLEDPQRLILEV